MENQEIGSQEMRHYGLVSQEMGIQEIGGQEMRRYEIGGKELRRKVAEDPTPHHPQELPELTGAQTIESQTGSQLSGEQDRQTPSMSRRVGMTMAPTIGRNV